MKKILSVMLMTLLLTACTTRTDYGKCIGIGGDEKPHLEYDISYWNIFMGVVFSETIVVPIVVAADQLYCPVAKKDVRDIEEYEDNKNDGLNNSYKDDNRHPRAESFEVPVEDKSFNKEKADMPRSPVEKEYQSK